jgi:hypothetical protein
MIDDEYLRQLAHDADTAVTPEIARERLAAREVIARLKTQLATTVKLPYVSASPVCEIDAGYAAGVNDCKEAILRAGFLVEGDD